MENCYMSKEAVKDYQNNCSLIGGILTHATVTKFLKEAVTNPPWVHSTTQQCADICVVDNVVYTGALNNTTMC